MRVKYKISQSTPRLHGKSTSTRPKPLKEDVKKSNDKMAKSARDKNLATCLAIFSSLQRPTKHSYANLVNACVRCGEIDLAAEYYSEMIVRLGECLVTSTTLLKGYFTSWRVAEATSLYSDILKKHDGQLGDRTVDTFLRGCIRTGMLEEGSSAFEESKCRSPHSIEMYHQMLLMRMRIPGETEMYGTGSSIASHIFVAKANTVRGRLQAAAKSLDDAELLMQTPYPITSKFEGHKKSEYLSQISRLRMHIREGCDMGVFSTYMNGNFLRQDSSRSPINQILKSRVKPGQIVKLEVCSGYGEWIVSRCIGEPDTLWIASELRFDRSFEVLLSAFLHGITNLVVCSGDVRNLLESLEGFSFYEIHCNFPEPPACHERESDSTNDLLTPQFIKSIMLKLQKSGIFKVVMDNHRYAEQLIIRMRQSNPVVECKTMKSDGVSYFDRLFQKGGKSSRYEIVVNS